MENFNTLPARILAFLLLAALFTVPPLWGGETRFMAIAWHDVADSREDLASDAVTTDHLVDQFEWLLVNGYHPVSIDRLLAAQRGEEALPEKPVLLCWDDGYQSFYTRVYPLLRAYDFPAVLALVGSWMEPDDTATVLYGDNRVPRTKFLSWDQVRELDRSGLVEIASHSWGLHKGILADGAGDRLPAVVAHAYDPERGTYESDATHKARILSDLQRNNALIAEQIGHAPRVLVWPFGRYNEPALQAAEEAGMGITLTLDPVPGDIRDLRAVGRVYPTLNPGLDTFRDYFELDRSAPVRRFFIVNSRDLLDVPGREVHFSRLLDRLVDVRPDMIAFEPVFGRGRERTALFPTDLVPRSRDRLIRLTWHTSRRGGTDAFLLLKTDLLAESPEFFQHMGRFGFSAGVLIDSPALVGSLFREAGKPPEQKPLFWDPSRRRAARRAWLAASAGTEDERITNLFTRLEAFQYWQPFIETGLLIPGHQAGELDPERVRRLLGWFDFLLLDLRGTGVLDDGVRQRVACLREAGLLPWLTVLFPYDGDDRRLGTRMAELPAGGIINWGYAGDRFLDRRPLASLVRPLMSRTVYPYQ